MPLLFHSIILLAFGPIAILLFSVACFDYQRMRKYKRRMRHSSGLIAKSDTNKTRAPAEVEDERLKIERHSVFLTHSVD